MVVSSRLLLDKCVSVRVRTLLIALLLGTALLGLPHLGMAQSSPSADSSAHAEAVDRVVQTFEKGTPETLFASAAERVELSVLGSRSYYSRSQAFYVIRDYLRQHAPRSFAIDRTAEADASLFVMGIYHHDQADTPVRVMVRFDEGSTAWVFHELRIEVAQP